MKVELEYIEQEKLTGIIVTDSQEGFFLETTKEDIKQWVFENGDEGTDYSIEKEWFDEHPEGGHYYNQKYLIEDAWDDQIRDYAFAHRKLWVQEQQEQPV